VVSEAAISNVAGECCIGVTQCSRHAKVSHSLQSSAMHASLTVRMPCVITVQVVDAGRLPVSGGVSEWVRAVQPYVTAPKGKDVLVHAVIVASSDAEGDIEAAAAVSCWQPTLLFFCLLFGGYDFNALAKSEVLHLNLVPSC
jgi:hypothetical protein